MTKIKNFFTRYLESQSILINEINTNDLEKSASLISKIKNKIILIGNGG